MTDIHKSAAFRDVCRVCGDEIPDNAGSLDYRCDNCVRAGKQVPNDPSKWHKKLLTERSTMSNLLTIILACKDGIARAFRRLTANGPYIARPEEALPSSILPDEVLRVGYFVPGHVASGVEVAKTAVEETTLGGTRVIYPAQAFAKSASQVDAPTSSPLTAFQRANLASALSLAASEDCLPAAEVIAKVRRSVAAVLGDVRICMFKGCGEEFRTNLKDRGTCDKHTMAVRNITKDQLDAEEAAGAYGARFVPTAPIAKWPGRPTEAGPDPNATRGDRLSRHVPEVPGTGYSEATRSAAAPSPGMLKGIAPDRAPGFGTFITSTCEKCDAGFETQAAPLPIRKVCDACLTKSY